MQNDMPRETKQAERGLTKKDWTLLVIDAAKPKTLTPIQLQKSLFLFGQRMPNAVKANFYEFVPHNFGPFAKEIYVDAVELKNEGLIDEITRDGQKWPEYRVTSAGSEQAKTLRDSLSSTEVAYLDELVKWVESQSFQDLLQAVYKAYPDFAKNSVFQH